MNEVNEVLFLTLVNRFDRCGAGCGFRAFGRVLEPAAELYYCSHPPGLGCWQIGEIAELERCSAGTSVCFCRTLRKLPSFGLKDSSGVFFSSYPTKSPKKKAGPSRHRAEHSLPPKGRASSLCITPRSCLQEPPYPQESMVLAVRLNFQRVPLGVLFRSTPMTRLFTSTQSTSSPHSVAHATSTPTTPGLNWFP